MALAILELRAFEQSNARFKIDTGTNRFYQLKAGKAVRRTHDIDWIDEVVSSTPIETNEASGDLLGTSKDVSISLAGFDGGKAYVQLFSFKTAGGISPAFSRVVSVPVGFTIPSGAPPDLAPALSVGASMKATTARAFRPPRTVACRTTADVYARQASLEELLAGIVKVAGPAVLALLGGARNGAAAAAPVGTAPPGGNANQVDMIVQLLRTVLGEAAIAGQPAVAVGQSFQAPSARANRFSVREGELLSHPFIFGVDDALIGMLVGPIVQMLPQLMNAANQRRVQMRQADNKLVTDILSDVNRRMMLDRLMQAKNPPAATGAPAANQADVDSLIQLLQQLPAAPSPAVASAVPPAPVVSAPQSMASSAPPTPSRKAMLSFVNADPVTWNGTQKVVFARAAGVQLRVQLNVAGPVPRTPLAKAIVNILFKEGDTVRLEKTFKHKDVAPNGVMACAFTPGELSRLPANVSLAVLAQMRWMAPASGREYSALGATDVVLVDSFFLREQGGAMSPPRELMDMKQFRPFWNKLWEAPLLDNARGNGTGEKRYRWELEANAKYSVLLSPDHEANGLMETKLAQPPADTESLTAKTEGRMKGGIELSLAELNKLVPLWDGESSLDAERLAALRTAAFARNNAGELIYNVKLNGKAVERGMVWMVPVFRLFEFTLDRVQRTDAAGQVDAVSEEKVRFPLPVSVRIIGLRSTDGEPDDDAAAAAGAEGYSFDGFTIVFADTIMLSQGGR